MPEYVCKSERGKHIDDRGVLIYTPIPEYFSAKRMYSITGPRGFVRAWHGHKEESKLIQSVSGIIKLMLVNMADETQRFTFFLEPDGSSVYVPAGHFNGFQHMTNDSILLVHSDKTTRESMNDDIRRDYSDFCNSNFNWSMDNYR